MAGSSSSQGLLGALSTFLGFYLRKIDKWVKKTKTKPARFGIIDVLLDQKGLRMGKVVESLF